MWPYSTTPYKYFYTLFCCHCCCRFTPALNDEYHWSTGKQDARLRTFQSISNKLFLFTQYQTRGFTWVYVCIFTVNSPMRGRRGRSFFRELQKNLQKFKKGQWCVQQKSTLVCRSADGVSYHSWIGPLFSRLSYVYCISKLCQRFFTDFFLAVGPKCCVVAPGVTAWRRPVAALDLTSLIKFADRAVSRGGPVWLAARCEYSRWIKVGLNRCRRPLCRANRSRKAFLWLRAGRPASRSRGVVMKPIVKTT